MSDKTVSIKLATLDDKSKKITLLRANDSSSRIVEKEIDLREFDFISGLLAHIFSATPSKDQIRFTEK